MRFKIVGANSETGDDVDVVLEAPSQPDVEKLAHDKHILVSTIAPLSSGPPPQPAHAGPASHGAHTPAHAPADAHGQAPAHAPAAHAPATHGPAHAPAAHAPATHGPAHAPAAHAPAAHGPAHAPAGHIPTRPPTEELASISLVDDDPPANGDPAAPHAERAHGLITVNANSPSETAHTGAGSIDHGAHAEAPMEYHIILNQSLFLLESAVNRHLRDGWEPAGGLSVGMSNNALQFFQSMIRKKKGPKAE